MKVKKLIIITLLTAVSLIILSSIFSFNICLFIHGYAPNSYTVYSDAISQVCHANMDMLDGISLDSKLVVVKNKNNSEIVLMSKKTFGWDLISFDKINNKKDKYSQLLWLEMAQIFDKSKDKYIPGFNYRKTFILDYNAYCEKTNNELDAQIQHIDDITVVDISCNSATISFDEFKNMSLNEIVTIFPDTN